MPNQIHFTAAQRSTYPLTAKLVDTVNDCGDFADFEAAEKLVRVFHAYEHGEADAVDIHPAVNLEILYEVYEDLILNFAFWDDDPAEEGTDENE